MPLPAAAWVRTARAWLTGYRARTESLPRLLGEALKGAGIVDREIGKDLAIEVHSGSLEAVDELVVAHPVQLGGSADADDPQRAVLTLFLFAPGVGKLQPALHGFFGGAIQFRFSKEVAARAI